VLLGAHRGGPCRLDFLSSRLSLATVPQTAVMLVVTEHCSSTLLSFAAHPPEDA
jgi:hypothetical protein